jgi:hypothetical protein
VTCYCCAPFFIFFAFLITVFVLTFSFIFFFFICSIPGTVLQSYAIISRFEDREWQQMVSLMASATAVGAISSRVSYYIDIDLKQREKAGCFYGYVPYNQRGRVVIQAAMMLMAVAQVLARSLSYALIAVGLSKGYAVLAFVSEAGLFFLYKLIRRDFYYQGIPNMHNGGRAFRFVASFLQRFVCKVLTDFTTLMVAR